VGSLDVSLLHFARPGRYLNVLHSCIGNAAMWSYILKRLLLMIPTVLGVLTLTFAVIQFVPGGPVEQMAHELRRGAEGGVPFGLRAHSGVDAQQIAQLNSRRCMASTSRRWCAMG
jgi:ABC-type microcin C transport system permease subunit YejB